ncbi:MULTISPECIES: arginase [unclassified Pseudomonas]|uniref:arginase n=1 Tax=unclassified Pseudomonas TaxID=196821 RepID=UPI0010C11186|nr:MULTISPECIES: arginase [unclassified Pseudomonas]MCX9150986.1 arginase [Pseudomonas sp. TB1-B1]TKJ64380.1 arginase [Pseudomonas sp. CFBP13506]
MNILDLDHSLTAQAPIARRLACGRATRIDLLDLGPKLRLWSTEKTWKRFAERLAGRPRPTDARPEILFVGSGDYHHLTPAFLADLKEPISLIHFDNHPDWVRFAPKRHCGSWVNRALKMPAIKRIVTLGPCSDDLHNPQLRGGNLGALKRGQLQLFPWQHPPSKVWGRVGDGAGHQQQENHLHWRNLAQLDWAAFLEQMISGLPTEAIWITIDKDVLACEDAATNWDQGGMRLTHLLQALRALAARKRIIGIDVCGEFATPAFSNAFKRWEAKSDQPPPQRWTPEDLQRNAATNEALIELFEELFP